jgi:hypothetical protein
MRAPLVRWFSTAAALSTLGAATLAVPAGADQSAPYTDASAVGYIGLCNQAGQQITSGSINTVPFAWRAVSSQPAQAPYNGPSRTAQLYAYQPIMGLTANDWSGDILTASARYSNPASPMAAATSADESLAQYMVEFKPDWDGFLELRMFLGGANEQAFTEHYPVLNIQVTGQTWQAVGGGSVNCRSGTAESIETILLPTTTTKGPASAASGQKTTGAGGQSGASSSSSTHVSQTPKGTPGGTSATHRGKTAGPGIHPWVVVVPVLAALVVLGAAALLLVRRRRRRSTPPANPDTPSLSHPKEPTTVGAASTKGIPQ